MHLTGECRVARFRQSIVSSLRGLLLALIVSGWVAGCLGQTIAKRGWAGSGITVDPWWKNAIFYHADPLVVEHPVHANDGGFRGIEGRLEYLQGLGVDAIVISPRQALEHPFDARDGSEDDLNSLLADASRRKIRVLIDLDPDGVQTAEAFAALARFWLTRGAAGFRLMHPAHSTGEQALSSAQRAERMRQLRRACAGFLGQRVLVWDMPNSAAGELEHGVAAHHAAYAESFVKKERGAVTQATPAEIALDDRLAVLTHLDAFSLRDALHAPAISSPLHAAYPMRETDQQDAARSYDRLGDGLHNVAIAKLLAATLLSSSGAPLLYSGQEVGMTDRAGVSASGAGARGGASVVEAQNADPNSLLNWYRKLSLLRHANATLHSGNMELLATAEPDTVAWIRRSSVPGHANAAVLVVLNLSANPVAVSLTSELQRLALPTGVERLHLLAASSTHAEPVSEHGMVSGIALPGYGVYIGELRPQPGLESVVLPVRAKHARSAH